MKNLFTTTFTKSILALLGLFLYANHGSAQDIHFSQFFETPLYRNPAFAGIFTGDIRAQAVYRNQWNSVTVPYQTGSVSVEYKLPIGKGNDFVTLGSQFFYDKAGSTQFKTAYAAPTINFHKSINKDKAKYLSLGFSAGYSNRSIDRSKITTNNMWGGNGFDPSLGTGETFLNTNYSYFDGGIGLSFSSNIGENDNNNYYVGAALHHFNRPRIGFYENTNVRLKQRISVGAGVKYQLSDYSFITIHADANKQDNNTAITTGALYTIKLVNGVDEEKYSITGGVMYRINDAIIPVVNVGVGKYVIGLSYDANTSTLRQASSGRGGFEFSIAYRGFTRNQNSTLDQVMCPKF
jgi:type IX secretion system PorP/SprF family membrane protein